MARQLVLLPPGEHDWRLDEQTKELGRRGISEARAALGQVTPAAIEAVPAAAQARVGAGR